MGAQGGEKSQAWERLRLCGGGGGSGGAMHRRGWGSWSLLAVPAVCTLLILAAAWGAPKAGSSGVAAWFKPLLSGGAWLGSYGGSGEITLPVASQREEREPPSGVSCSEVLGVKKVALLFLAGSNLHHDSLWRLWLESAAGLLPQQLLPSLTDAACGDVVERWLLLMCACFPRRVSGAAAAVQPPWQYLFNLYVHTQPWGVDGYQGLPEGSVFHGHVIKERVRTEAGHVSLVDAARLLLRAALGDPQNERFVLISGSTLPLYDPLTFYQQLMHERGSRLGACGAQRGDGGEGWRDEMQGPLLRREHWRRGSPHFSLTREHAQLAATEQEVYQAFRDHCPRCQPEERYWPTLLAARGLENGTLCGAAADWGGGGGDGQPREYRPSEVSPALLQQARGGCGKVATLAARDAHRMFLPWETLLGAANCTQACQRLRASHARSLEHPLPPACALTARKFPPDTAPAALRLFAGTCAAAEETPPGTMTEGEAAADRKLYLLRGRACTLAHQAKLV